MAVCRISNRSNTIRYTHTNLIANDWKALSRFYQAVFNCKPVKPERNLSGVWLEKLTGIADVKIVGEHLEMPGYDQSPPTLEIFSYSTDNPADKQINTCGFAHIAFEVDDVQQTTERVISAGGSLLGEIVSNDYGSLGIGTFVYVKDPEGNLIELQSWKR